MCIIDQLCVELDWNLKKLLAVYTSGMRCIVVNYTVKNQWAMCGVAWRCVELFW